MPTTRIKKVFMLFLRIVLILLLVAAALILFVWFEGIQYSLALLTGTIRDPYFNVEQHRETPNCFGAEICESGPMRVLTYNVLCRICVKEEYDPWDVRITHLRGLVERYDPDLIGSQELGGWKDILEYLPEGDKYAIVTFEFGPWAYSDSALFYRAARYELLDSGHFWLSPKPHLPFAFPWKPLSAPRYVTWAYLRDRGNGFTFLFANSHVDNNPVNKDTSAPIIFDTFSRYADAVPVIFTGDFNTNPTTERYSLFQRGHGDTVVFHNTADLVAEREEVVYPQSGADTLETAPFEGFDHTIDHIFVAGHVDTEVLRWVVDRNRYGEALRPASDHPAIYGELRLRLLP